MTISRNTPGNTVIQQVYYGVACGAVVVHRYGIGWTTAGYTVLLNVVDNVVSMGLSV